MEKLIQEYLEYRKTLNLSRQTLQNNWVQLRKFHTYLIKKHMSWNKVSPATIMAYWNWLQPLASRPNYLITLKQFYQYAVTHDLILLNPFRNLELDLGKPSQVYRIPTFQELRQILESINLSVWYGRRDRAILELTYSSGLRADEIIRLNLEDLDLANRLVRVRGKGAKERTVPFGKTAAFYLKMYLKDRDRKNPALFQNLTGGRICHNILQKQLKRYTKTLGFNFKFHSLRHACALHMLQNNASIRYIQELLGHSHLESTQIYTQLLPLDLKKVHHRFHPREKGVHHG